MSLITTVGLILLDFLSLSSDLSALINTTCKRRKSKQSPYRRSDSRASQPLELVLMNLAGPHTVTGFDGWRYFFGFRRRLHSSYRSVLA
ncbi:hypothetical protein TYRP_017225 [Tyrophagus putrescentiae]|nr:hypothetical protein TYRP_017225 [Tyrophagus putrescentiae]